MASKKSSVKQIQALTLFEFEDKSVVKYLSSTKKNDAKIISFNYKDIGINASYENGTWEDYIKKLGVSSKML